jgi:uncharacterized membrane protein
MRLIPAGLVTLGLVALVGCNSSPPGGSGSGVPKKATFKIEAPTLSTTLKQGDTKEVKLTLDRGKDFHDDVDLKFDAPTGLMVDPSTLTVKADDSKDVTVKVSAAKDAPLGDHIIKVTATPKAGTATSVDIKVKVDKSDAK